MTVLPADAHLSSATVTLIESAGSHLLVRRIALYSRRSLEGTCYATWVAESDAHGTKHIALALTGEPLAYGHVEDVWLYVESGSVVGRTDIRLRLTWNDDRSTTPLAVVDGAGYGAPFAYWFRLADLSLVDPAN